MEKFNNKKPNKNRLISFGFIEENNNFVYNTQIMNGEFTLKIEIFQSKIKTEVTEVSTGELYTLHLIEGADGKFIGKIREEYEKILNSIADNCFETDVFKSPYTKKVMNYINEKYKDNAEYLWEKFPNNAIYRRKKSGKWYAAILTVKKSKLGFDSEEETEIIDLHALPENVTELIKDSNIYPGYHMNKKHWITVILDGSVELKRIYKLIDESYKLS